MYDMNRWVENRWIRGITATEKEKDVGQKRKEGNVRQSSVCETRRARRINESLRVKNEGGNGIFFFFRN